MKKRLIALMLIFCMTLSISAVSAFAAGSELLDFSSKSVNLGSIIMGNGSAGISGLSENITIKNNGKTAIYFVGAYVIDEDLSDEENKILVPSQNSVSGCISFALAAANIASSKSSSLKVSLNQSGFKNTWTAGSNKTKLDWWGDYKISDVSKKKFETTVYLAFANKDFSKNPSDALMIRGTETNGNQAYSFVNPTNMNTYDASYITDVKITVDLSLQGSGTSGKKLTHYIDVPAGAIYEPALKWAYDNGVANGVSLDEFLPAGYSTRGEIVTVLWRASGKPEPKGDECWFTDVNPKAFYYKALRWAVEEGIINGVSETEFAPNDYCTNAHIITMIYRAIGSPNKPASQSYWYEAAANWADSNGIRENMAYSTEYSDNCARANMVSYLYRYNLLEQ